MRRFILLLTVALIVLAILYHQRLFLRDPLGKVERNGIAVADARVFINYSNDILVQEEGGRRMFVVQNYNRLPGAPAGLTCFQGLLCLTPSDQAVPGPADPDRAAAMSNREVSFVDSLGARVRVQIR